jgi:hypothetical protein
MKIANSNTLLNSISIVWIGLHFPFPFVGLLLPGAIKLEFPDQIFIYPVIVFLMLILIVFITNKKGRGSTNGHTIFYGLWFILAMFFAFL